MRNYKQARIYKPFEDTAKKLFPHKSMSEVTKEINKILEEIVYGKKQKR